MSMKIEILPAREAIAREGGIVHVAVRVTPEKAAERAPVALALVVDNSGSMSEAAGQGTEGHAPPSKMRFVKEAAHFLADLLGAADSLALVSFSGTAHAVLPLTESDDRTRLHTAIEGLQPMDSTNLEAGLRTGIEQLRKAAASGVACRLVILSDGETNAGQTDAGLLANIAAAAAAKGITVSSVGVGFGYNSALLGLLADRGNGSFHHVENPHDSEHALTAELFDAAEVTARGVEVEIAVPAPAGLPGANLNGYPERTTRTGCIVSIGDLARPRDIVFEIGTTVPVKGDVLKIKATAKGRSVEGAELHASATLPIRVVSAEEIGAAGEDAAVVALVWRLLVAKAESLVAAAMEAGDMAGAQGAVQSLGFARTQKLRYSSADPALQAQVDDLQSSLSVPMSMASAKQMNRKSMTSRRSGDLSTPFGRSFWVAEPDLLAGCYPGDEDPAVAAAKLRGLAQAGIRTIVNLMVPGETSHGGKQFSDYTEMARDLGMTVVSHPIPDFGTVDSTTMSSILDAIDGSVAGGNPVYVHCWGGRGRTGTVVGCWLVRHGRATPATAIRVIKQLRSGCPDAAHPAPESPRQVAMVEGWQAGR